MNVKVYGKKLCVNTEHPFDTAGSPPKPHAPKRRPGKKPKK